MTDEPRAMPSADPAPPPADPAPPPARLPYLRRRGLLPRHRAAGNYALRRTFAELRRDDAVDEAAALTYWSVLSLLPAVLAMVSILGVVGQGESTTRAILEVMHEIVDDDVADVLAQPIADFASKEGAGWLLVIGLVGAMWFASNYVTAFSRSMNRMYRVEEGRPGALTVLLGFLLTATLVVMLAVAAVLLVVSGGFAEALLRVLELPRGLVLAWTFLKWPLVLLLVLLAIAMLYHLTPNVVPRAFSLLTPGALVALAVGVLATSALGLFLFNFPDINYYYGALTGILVFLLWLYVINLALLLGARLNAELERGVELEAGLPAERSIQLLVHSTRASARRAARYEHLVRRARVLRLTRGVRSREEGPG